MKKIIVFSFACILTLTSFGTFNDNLVKNLDQQPPFTELKTFRYTCSDGRTGTFQCYCELPSAQLIANNLCSKSLSPA